MKEIKQRLNEIKCFSQLYKYIGCDLLKSNDINNEIVLISYAYVKAKNKRYINIRSLDNNKQYNSFTPIPNPQYNNTIYQKYNINILK